MWLSPIEIKPGMQWTLKEYEREVFQFNGLICRLPPKAKSPHSVPCIFIYSCLYYLRILSIYLTIWIQPHHISVEPYEIPSIFQADLYRACVTSGTSQCMQMQVKDPYP